MSDPAASPAPEAALPEPGDRVIAVVMNAGSGAGETATRTEALEAAFARHAARFRLEVVAKGGSIGAAAAAAVRGGCDTVVAAGGDGTIIAVAQELLGTGVRLGVVPFGTFNYFARSLDVPEDVDAAVRLLLEGTARAIHVGTVNGEVFLNNASLGAYASVLHNREEVYRKVGRNRIVAYFSALSTLARFRRPLTLKVTVDGKVLRVCTPLAFVSNNAYQLDRLDLAGGDCVRDGRFALFIAPDCSRLELVKYAFRLAARAMEPGRDYEMICGRDILVESRQRRRLVARDGERQRMSGPFRFCHCPEALEVLVPRAG